MSEVSQGEQRRRWRRVCRRWGLPMPHGWTAGLLEQLERAAFVVKARKSS